MSEWILKLREAISLEITQMRFTETSLELIVSFILIFGIGFKHSKAEDCPPEKGATASRGDTP
jgi:hypothetical protein